RANLLSAFVPARRRVGYDRSRSKDLHGLFINERIPDRPGIHVLDAIGSFCEPLGLVQDRVEWNLPVPDDAYEWAAAQWPDDGTPVLMISPCSSHQRRNWYPDRYAALADHAAAGWGAAAPMPASRRCEARRWTWSARTRSRSCLPCSSAPTCWSPRTRARCTSPTPWARRCWACTRPAPPPAAGRTRTAATAST